MAPTPRDRAIRENNLLCKKIWRLAIFSGVLILLATAFAYSHRVYRSGLGPVAANCGNPSAWGYAEIGDETGRLYSWAEVRVAGLDARQEYEVIVYRRLNPRPTVLGSFRTGFDGYGSFHATRIPLGSFDVVNVRLPGKHGTAVLSSGRV